jgi:Xaa-Pro aminopeptidase
MIKQSNLVKEQVEIINLRRAGELSSQLHTLGMSQALIGKSEANLAKYFNSLKESMKDSMKVSAWAYPVIIGASERSTILHAKPTRRIFNDGDLVLVDMGLKYKGYCCDITRTWPAGKKFSKEQKKIYKIVLKAQKEVIKRVRPGVSLDYLHEVCKKFLLEGLLSKDITKSENIERYYPHKTSHWIGRDVHDKCPYYYIDKSPITLSRGMCFTIEPGLYFKNTNSVYEGIGIRIEDVVLVTENGCEVLSNVPKEIDEIEAIRSLVV